MNKWIYEILLNGKPVLDSGDDIFKTEEEANEDAEYCIKDYLADEYKEDPSEFEVCLYCAVI